MSNNNEDPSSAPEPGRWYNITLGSSFRDNNHHADNHPKFCTLRYEFRPASIDTSQPGTLHKSKDNRVTLEFQNNQQGKPKVVFEGVSEDYKDNDAVLFFDSDTFRLERLHRAKRLRHVRLPGEPVAGAASTASTLVVPAVESHSPPAGKGSKPQPPNTGIVHDVVDSTNYGNSTSLGAEPENQKVVEPSSFLPDLSKSPSEAKNLESEEFVDIVNDNDYSSEVPKRGTPEKEFRTGLDIDINLPHPVNIDDEIADVDVSDNEPDKGPNAAEALRAQLNAEAEERNQASSSSSSSSESESSDTEGGSASGSGSGSSSSSSDGESSYGGSVNSI